MAKTKGATRIGEAERRIIRILLEAGEPVSSIARHLHRTRQAIYAQIRAMDARGDFAQYMLPLAAEEKGRGHGEG